MRSLLLLLLLVTLDFLALGQAIDDDRIDAFYRCIADFNLPTFSKAEAKCSSPTFNTSQYEISCGELTSFADYDLTRTNLSTFDFIIQKNNLNISLTNTAKGCIEVFFPGITDDHDGEDYDHYDHYDGKSGDDGGEDYDDYDGKRGGDGGEDYDYNGDQQQQSSVYEGEACLMSAFKNNSYTSNGTLNFVLYTYLTIEVLYFTQLSEDVARNAITEGYLDTCTSTMFQDDMEKCVYYLIESCFLLELYDPYYCFDSIVNRLCSEFDGDKRFKCEVILEERLISALEDTCSHNENDGKCERTFSSVLEKPIVMVNSSDINQLRSIVAGGVQRMNHTKRSLEQLNEITAYFHQNETAVSLNWDNKDVTEFYEVIDILLNVDRIGLLLFNGSTEDDVGISILNNIEEISRVASLSILNRNNRVSRDFQFDGSNTKFKFDVGRHKQDYSSGDLLVNSSSSMSASIAIPRSVICDEIDELDIQDIFEDEYFGYYEDYYYDDPAAASGDYYYYFYYDLIELFGNCSKVLNLPRGCETVVTTSVAQNIPEALSFGLPSDNMSFASLVLSSNIMKMSSTGGGQVSLSEDATLHFTLTQQPVSVGTLKCFFFDKEKRRWSSDGVETVLVGENEVTCTTKHLTSFAVLADYQGVLEEIPKEERVALSIVGYIGPSISIVCLIASILLMLIFRKRISKGALGVAHFNLCLALLLSLVVLVAGLEPSRNIRLCGLVTGLLQYLLLCVFCWMLVEGIILYLKVVHVWSKIKRWYLFLPFGWGLPLIITGIAVGVKHDLYGSNQLCWLTPEDGLIWAFLGPAVFICVINTGILCITVFRLVKLKGFTKSDAKSSKSQKMESMKSTLIAVFVLSPLLGTTWIIGLFAINSKTSVFLWLFTILNSLQGAAIFVLHVLRIKDLSSRILKRKRKQHSTIQSSLKFSSKNSYQFNSVEEEDDKPVDLAVSEI